MAKKNPAVVRARVLVDGAGLHIGQVVEAAEAQIKALEAGGVVDAHPDAVAYALSEDAQVVPLPSVEPVAEVADPEAPTE